MPLLFLLASALASPGTVDEDPLANAPLADHAPPPPEGAPPEGSPGERTASCTPGTPGKGPKPVVGDIVTLRVLVWAGGAWRDPGKEEGDLTTEVDNGLMEIVGDLQKGGTNFCWTADFDTDAWSPAPLWIELRDLTHVPPPKDLLKPPKSTTAGGVPWRKVRRGDGPPIGPLDLIQLEIRAWDASGALMPVDSLGLTGEPMHARELADLRLGVDDAWTVLRAGGTARFWPREPAMAIQALQITVIDHAEAPHAPADPAFAPGDSAPLANGARWLRIDGAGAGAHVGRWDRACIHASGWTASETLRWDMSADDGVCVVVAQGAAAQPDLPAAVLDLLGELSAGDAARVWVPQAGGVSQGAPELWQVKVDTIEPGIEPPPDVAAVPADATVTASGLAYKRLSPPAAGPHPTSAATVRVHYTGWTTDGVSFDSSVQRGEPASFPLDRVIPGWTEGLQLLAAGDRARLWIPGSLAYDGQTGAPAGMLVFDVELLSFREPPPAPPDVSKPPPEAHRSATGLKWLTLQPGTGKVHPSPEARVTVHYSGWTTDGALFDSSLLRDRPSTFPLYGVIPGWSEGVQQMVVGERARIWIPEPLAYDGQEGRPAGMLVFEVELLQIEEPTDPPTDSPDAP